MAKKSGKAKAKPAKPKASSTSKQVTKQAKTSRAKQPSYTSLKLQKRIKHPVKLPSVWSLTKQAFNTVWEYRLLFVGIAAVYGLLNILLAQSLSGANNVTDLKNSLDDITKGQFGGLGSGLGVFAILLGSSGNSTSASAGAYQFFIGLITSLAVIWTLRQVTAGTKVRIRDGFYRGMYPLVPFVLVLLVVGLQLIPLLIGSTLYNAVITNNIAVYAIEKLIWGLLYGLLALLSLYMITSSLFALYIVTLPDMTPMKALRSARTLVQYRRWTVMRKIICLPLILLVVAVIVMLPIILWLTPLAQAAFFALSMLGLIAVHAYMYTLYRELLNE